MTTNHVNGAMNGLQAGDVHGNVTITQLLEREDEIPREGELRHSTASDGELADVRTRFVDPEGMDQARRVIVERSVVVVHGIGSGRASAGLRLLTELRCGKIVRLNPARRLFTAKADDLWENEGYLWESTGPGSTVVNTSDFDHICRLVQEKGARLVIVVDHLTRLAAAPGSVVELKPPHPAKVARAFIHAKRPDRADIALAALNGLSSGALNIGDPPRMAIRAAELALLVADGELDQVGALRELTRNADNAVADGIGESWSTSEHTMQLAVAMLENGPLDEVVAFAADLNALVREAESPKDKQPRPQRIFLQPRDKLLDDIQATLDLREHPLYPGLEEYTVRFKRPDWAAAVLRRFWRQYHLDRSTLVDWMCIPRAYNGLVKALCTMITEVPATRPLHELDRLAASNSVYRRHVAAGALTRLADGDKLSKVVEQTLDDWVEIGSPNRKCTAALVYGRRFGRTEPERALRQLATIGRTTSKNVHGAVVRAMLGLLCWPEHRELALQAVPLWADDLRSARKQDGLRAVALDVGLRILGVFPDSDELFEPLLNPVDLGQRYPEQVGELAWMVATDRRYGAVLLSKMDDLGYWHQFPVAATSDRDDAELLRLACLIAPDLRWWRRRRVVAELTRHHPARRPMIRRIFRVARKIQKSTEGLQTA